MQRLHRVQIRQPLRVGQHALVRHTGLGQRQARQPFVRHCHPVLRSVRLPREQAHHRLNRFELIILMGVELQLHAIAL